MCTALKGFINGNLDVAKVVKSIKNSDNINTVFIFFGYDIDVCRGRTGNAFAVRANIIGTLGNVVKVGDLKDATADKVIDRILGEVPVP